MFPVVAATESSMNAIRAALLVLSTWVVAGHRHMLSASSQLPQAWPPEWDVPVNLMSRGDRLARGGAMQALGREKMARIRQRASVTTNVNRLAKVLDTDEDLYVDPANDRLMFKCHSLVILDNSTTAVASGIDDNTVSATAVLTKADVFSLSSNPGAPKVILLDFDGQTVQNTWWNNDQLSSINAKAYDKDNSPQSFSQSELQDIVDIWRAVAEDYAPFNVDVTTKDPGDAALLSKGVRVIIGGSSQDWYGQSAGGVAWVGSFGTGNPVFIWPELLGPFRPKYIADAASHEVGHVLGLLHDGNTDTGSSYYAGQGSWGPIMGVSYLKDLTQFDKGEYKGSNNNQDDFAVMSQYLDLHPQKYGNSINSATAIPPSKTISGIISNPMQRDYFSFSATAGSATITVAVAAPAAGRTITNLDTRLILFDSTGRVMRSSNPAGVSVTAVGASIRTELPSAGIYYVSVTGVGSGDPKTTGYSSYGSRGQYTLTVNYTSSGGGNGEGGTVDCRGTWSSWSQCSARCGGGVRTSTYKVTVPAGGAGTVCPFKDGEARRQTCNTQACTGSNTILVRNIVITTVSLANGRARCKSRVLLRTPHGAPVGSAYVMGRWSVVTAESRNAYSASVGAITADTGVVTFTTAVFTPASASNSCSFHVTDVSLDGYMYQSTAASSKRHSWP